MRPASLLAGICVISALQPLSAQTSSRPRPPSDAAAPTRLPVRRVVLYKNGVGYFEHLGRVRGTQTLSIDFNTSQLNDVLKSLTTVDLADGRIADVSFNSDTPLAKRLSEFAPALGEKATLADLLGSLRGVRLEVRGGGRVVVGRLVGVERRRAKDDAPPRDEVTLVSDTGDLRTMALTPAVTVRLVERESAEQLTGYLGVLASTHRQDRRTMTITAIGEGSRDVMVGYVSEVPIWKTSYRIVLPANRTDTPRLQGWAIVDNTIGEDWNDVQLSLVAGAPQSFVQALAQPVYGQRPVVGIWQSAVPVPQTHAETASERTGSLSGRAIDQRGAVLPGVTVTITSASGRRFSAATDAHGRYLAQAVPPGAYRVEFALPGFQTTTIDRLDLDGAPRQLADTVLNIDIGTVSETLNVSAGRSRSSIPLGYAHPTPGADAAAATAAVGRDRAYVETRLAGGSGRSDEGEQQAEADGRSPGDLFEYRVAGPITIRKNQSAMVPILTSSVAAERISVWNERAGVRPLRSVWLTNTSGLTLDGGSFTVLEDATFAGEGLIEPMRPGERRLLSYAVDLGVQVESRHGDEQQQISRIRIDHGVAVVHNEQRSRKIYAIRNNDASPRTIVVEHPIRAGWTLSGGAEPAESSGSSYRFLVHVEAKHTASLTVEERHPTESRVTLAQLDDRQLVLFVRNGGDDARLKEALGPILETKAHITSLTEDLEARHGEANQIGEEQQRLRENIGVLKGSAGERQLLKRYVAQLDSQEDRIAVLRREAGALETELAAARQELAALIERLSFQLEMADATAER